MTTPTDPPIPLGRLTIIGLLSDHGYTQAHGDAEGFTVDFLGLDQPPAFRVRWSPPAGTREIVIPLLADPLRSAGWDVETVEVPALHLLVRSPLSPGRRSLAEVTTGPYLAGRLAGLAQHLGAWYDARGTAGDCGRYADKIARGGLPPTLAVIGQLSGMVYASLRPCEVPATYRDVYRDITARIAELAEPYPAPPWTTAGQGEFVLGLHHQSAALAQDVPGR